MFFSKLTWIGEFISAMNGENFRRAVSVEVVHELGRVDGHLIEGQNFVKVFL